jgi:HAMP domain-containing protein
MARSDRRLVVCGVACLSMLTAAAWAAPDSRPLEPVARAAAGGRLTHRISFPAQALGRANTADFAVTIRKPREYAGGRVRVTMFFQAPDDPIEDTTVSFNVTPVSLNDGSGFETFGSVATEERPKPGITVVEQRSATLKPGTSFGSFDGDWWYFEIGRGGTYTGRVRLFSVSVEY